MALSLNALHVNDIVFFNMKREMSICNMKGKRLKEVFEYRSKVLEVDKDNHRVLISGLHFHNGQKWLYVDSYGRIPHIRRTSIKK